MAWKKSYDSYDSMVGHLDNGITLENSKYFIEGLLLISPSLLSPLGIPSSNTLEIMAH